MKTICFLRKKLIAINNIIVFLLLLIILQEPDIGVRYILQQSEQAVITSDSILVPGYHKLAVMISCEAIKSVVQSSSPNVRVCSQSERKQLVRSMCEKYNNTGSPQRFISFTIDPVNKVAFHDIEKIGSTTWLSIMSNISMEGKLTSRQMGFHTRAIKRYGLHRAKYTPEEFRTELPGFTKFVVVRNPLHRLYSGYNNKIVKSKPPGYRNALKRFLNINMSVSVIPTFQGFLTMIASNEGFSNDVHFSPYFKNINPCFMDFDYILKLETQNRDLAMFLSEVYKVKDASAHLQVHQLSLTVPKNTTPAMNDSVFLKAYKTIPHSLLSQVMQKFKYEMEIFGYHFNVSSAVASCCLNTVETLCC